MKNKEKYFIFMDESGNNAEDKYFALGILIIPLSKIGKIYDNIWSHYDTARNIAKTNKNNKIQEYIDDNKLQDLKSILKSSIDFELKSKNINFTNKHIYKSLISDYFKYKDLKFASLIIDKEDGKKDFSAWQLYIHRAGMLIASTIKSIENNKYFNSGDYILIADHITKPKGEIKTFEESICENVKNRLNKANIDNDIFFGATRQESHSSVLLQLVDILLGNVVYFIKEPKLSEKSKEKKGFVANHLKEKLGNPDMLDNFTKYNPNYFSVWYYKK